MKKYEILKEDILIVEHRRVYRIKALKSFGKVKAGDLGGYIECPDNLAQRGKCWVSDNAIVCDNAIVIGNALIKGNAIIKGEACICDNAVVSGESIIEDRAIVCGNAEIEGKSHIYSNPQIAGKTHVSNSKIHGNVILNDRQTYRDIDFPCHDQDDLDDLIKQKVRRNS